MNSRGGGAPRGILRSEVSFNVAPSIFRSNVSRCGLVTPWNTFQFSGFRRLSLTARLSMDRLSAAMSARRAGEHLSSPYDGAMRSRRVVVRINQHRHGVHKQTSANLYKGTGSRFAQGISNAAPVTVSGWWFELSRCRRLQAAGNRAMSSVRHRGPARALSLSLSLTLNLEKKKSVHADPVAGIKMQVVRACASPVHSARRPCFMGDSFVCSAVGIIFPSKLRYTWNNGEIKT